MAQKGEKLTQKGDACIEINKKLDTLNKLLILHLFYNDVPAELIAKATDMHPNSIRNMFPIKKYKKGSGGE